MLEKITGTFSSIVKTLSGKSSITEKNIEETVAEAVSQIESPRHRLVHTAENIDEARHIFNEEMPNHCRIHNIIEQDDCFIINYENHRANTAAEYYQTVEVERAE